MKIAKHCVCCNSQKLVGKSAVLMPFISDRIFNWKPTLITKQWSLNTIKSGMAYSVCSSLLCLDCNLLFLDMRFDDEELSQLYYKYRDKNYSKLRNKYEPGYNLINEIQNRPIKYTKNIENFLSPLLKFPIKVLDYGGDDGHNTPFRNSQNTTHVFDISNKPAIKNVKIVNEKNMLKKYDLIILSHVIEHVSYPKVIINKIKNILNKNSIFYIELPLETFLKKIWHKGTKKDFLKYLNKKKHWHEHINFYSKKSLIKLLAQCGLKIIKMNTLSVEVYKSAEVVQIACKKI